MKRPLYWSVCGIVLVFAGCADKERRPSSDLCTEGHQCELGYCIDGHCLDPLGDEDLDELLNETEVMLGTDPFDPDTDKDGELDGEEIAEFVDPSDEDGDGLFDAVESNLLDEDCDGLSNQADANFSELACDDEISCTDEFCDPPKGCIYAVIEGACDDELPCTDDLCDPTNGCTHTALEGACDDELPCTDDLCDPTNGCTHTALEGACDDGDPCTANDTCVESVCVGGAPEVKNLVESGDGESWAGWSNKGGGWGTEFSAACDEAPESVSGCCFLVVGDACGGVLSDASQIDQDLWIGDVSSQDQELSVQLHTMVGAVYEQTVAIILLEPFDSTGQSLGEPLRYEVQQSPWVELIETAPIPAETDFIRLSLRAEREQAGPLAAVFDDLHVGVLGCAD